MTHNVAVDCAHCHNVKGRDIYSNHSALNNQIPKLPDVSDKCTKQETKNPAS